MQKESITQSALKELLDYDPKTGIFRWKVYRGGTASVGSVAGNMHHTGYWVIKVYGKRRPAHRLAWLYTHGTWPEDQIDHRDGDKLNNRIENLREATCAENSQNRGIRSNNKSGFIGVSWCNRARRWVAQIQHQGKRRHVGYFGAAEEAHAAYLNAKATLHTFQPTPREA